MIDKNKLQDYIHYYLGCRAVAAPFGGQPKRKEQGIITCVHFNHVDIKLDNWQSIITLDVSLIKPILRKSSDYEGEELNEYQTLVGKRTEGGHYVVMHYDTPETFHWLLKKGFDLFGLIDAGLAIDAKTLK